MRAALIELKLSQPILIKNASVFDAAKRNRGLCEAAIILDSAVLNRKYLLGKCLALELGKLLCADRAVVEQSLRVGDLLYR